MLRFIPENLKHVLCLGAHSDDIEIGCGGALLHLLRARPGFRVSWVVFSGGGERTREARRSARAFLGRSAAKIITRQFRASYFLFEGARIKDFFETIKLWPTPDLIFTHHRDDRHQDHRMISELKWNTFRNHFVLEYEIPKYDGELGQPNFFLPLDSEVCREKVRHIGEFFKTQTKRQWFSDDTFLALMRLRGVECASPTHYAEGFYTRKLVMAGGPAPI